MYGYVDLRILYTDIDKITGCILFPAVGPRTVSLVNLWLNSVVAETESCLGLGL